MEASTVGSVLAPLPGRCAFYVTKKKRYCKMTVGRGKTFCGEHANAGEDNEKKRIPCPLDPKHTVYQDHLAKHLNKCNSKEKPQPRYYVKDINAGTGSEGEAIVEISIADRTKEELDELIVKLKTALQGLNTQIVENTLSHTALNEALNDPKNGDSASKHLKQQASILGNMEALKLLSPDRCYIEFGAGKGKLSHWIHVALKASENVHFLLVERSSTRFKVDGKHKNADSTFDRLQVDIQHLDLNLALRCLFECIRKDEDEPPTKRVKLQQEEGASDETKPREGLVVSGMAIALCCHHRCDWRHYVGKEFFRQRGLGPKEFAAFQRMSSWATCGMKKFSSEMPEQLNDHKTEEVEEHEIDEESITDTLSSVMSVEDREQIGRLCKLLIDQGRVHYLKQRGFESSLKYYTSRDVSLENVLLTAVPSSNQKTDESKLNTNST
ncbi:tRNA:m(4)X modification enzyme TRM13 -like protein [Triplophysa tibetana]|uniref:tRNA:m(4)X modification enzyme TRM13 n=1 Tax=Triplophysa tibetana TaxID=1572043 RepID=A0A5A9NR05_9TELE|nr:tRNA:m(4)X modification enzyme TRM13 -like protein [Triplophysa tibetana]